MSKKLSLKNIKNFLSGYGRLIYHRTIGLPQHEKEQIEYRAYLCKNDCAIQGYCKVCGCDFPGRIFTPNSCNPERFPDQMSSEEWQDFKNNNNIE